MYYSVIVMTTVWIRSKMLKYVKRRIVTGAIKRTPSEKLYNELSWDPIKNRYNKHKLILFHKMQLGLSPSYLNSLVPETIGTSVRYNLRNQHDLHGLYGRTDRFQKSFIPSTVKEWNCLDCNLRNAENCNQFKSLINKDVNKCNLLFYYGTRRENVFHARLRMKCSSLNGHLYDMYIVESPRCSCGYTYENTEHYFLHCNLYNTQRAQLLTNVYNYTQSITTDTLLYGDCKLNDESNRNIFSSVHKFIAETKRFN